MHIRLLNMPYVCCVCNVLHVCSNNHFFGRQSLFYSYARDCVLFFCATAARSANEHQRTAALPCTFFSRSLYQFSMNEFCIAQQHWVTQLNQAHASAYIDLSSKHRKKKERKYIFSFMNYMWVICLFRMNIHANKNIFFQDASLRIANLFRIFLSTRISS